MAKNDNTLRDLEKSRETIKECRMRLRKAEQIRRRVCDHRTNGAVIKNVHDSNLRTFVQNPNQYGPNVVVCEECGQIFDLDIYSKKELDDMAFKLDSMLSQINLIAELSDDEKDDLVDNGYGSVDDMRRFMAFYCDMVNKLRNKNNQQPQKKTSKGGYGISSGMFGGSR